MKIKCLDTYALIEIINGNPQFIQYISENIIITDITLAEFYAVLLREQGEETADYWYNKMEVYGAQVQRKILIKAVKLRYKLRKQRVSFFDAVGYVYAQENNYLFVTGDKEFKDMKDVEFRKG